MLTVEPSLFFFAQGQWAVGSVTFTAVVVGVNLRLGLEGKCVPVLSVPPWIDTIDHTYRLS